MLAAKVIKSVGQGESGGCWTHDSIQVFGWTYWSEQDNIVKNWWVDTHLQ